MLVDLVQVLIAGQRGYPSVVYKDKLENKKHCHIAQHYQCQMGLEWHFGHWVRRNQKRTERKYQDCKDQLKSDRHQHIAVAITDAYELCEPEQAKNTRHIGRQEADPGNQAHE